MFTDNLKINVNKLNSDENLIEILEINHPLLSLPVRLVNDNKDVISNGENYISTILEFQLQNDIEGELPKAKLTLPNIGRKLVRWIVESYGAEGAEIKVSYIMRSDPDDLLFTIPTIIESTSLNIQTVTLNLVVLKNNLIQDGINYIFSKRLSAGIF